MFPPFEPGVSPALFLFLEELVQGTFSATSGVLDQHQRVERDRALAFRIDDDGIKVDFPDRRFGQKQLTEP